MGSQFNRGVKILSVGGVVIQWPPVSGGRNSTWKIRWILIAARWIKTPRVEIQWGQNSILHRQIRLTHLRNRFQTAEQAAATIRSRNNVRISAKTVRNRWREHGIRARRPYVGLVLTRHRRNVRLNWMNRHSPRRFPLRRYRHVLFTDESWFSLHRADRRRKVYRPKGERFANACVTERDRFGGGSVMVWGGIANGLKTPSVVINGSLNAKKYRKTFASSRCSLRSSTQADLHARQCATACCESMS